MSGRKQLAITFQQVHALRRHPDRYTWDQIAMKLQCSRRTAIRIWDEGRARRSGAATGKKRAPKAVAAATHSGRILN